MKFSFFSFLPPRVNPVTLDRTYEPVVPKACAKATQVPSPRAGDAGRPLHQCPGRRSLFFVLFLLLLLRLHSTDLSSYVLILSCACSGLPFDPSGEFLKSVIASFDSRICLVWAFNKIISISSLLFSFCSCVVVF